MNLKELQKPVINAAKALIGNAKKIEFNDDKSCAEISEISITPKEYEELLKTANYDRVPNLDWPTEDDGQYIMSHEGGYFSFYTPNEQSIEIGFYV